MKIKQTFLSVFLVGMVLGVSTFILFSSGNKKRISKKWSDKRKLMRINPDEKSTVGKDDFVDLEQEIF